MIKKLFLLTIICIIFGACSFHSKQPIDDSYYKKTQGVVFLERKN